MSLRIDDGNKKANLGKSAKPQTTQKANNVPVGVNQFATFPTEELIIAKELVEGKIATLKANLQKNNNPAEIEKVYKEIKQLENDLKMVTQELNKRGNSQNKLDKRV